MQAGFIASAGQRSGRYLRFLTLATALVIIDMSLWVRLVQTGSAGVTIGDAAVALMVATTSIIAMLALWRNPLGRSTRTMITPALRQMLATHHAGHIVAAYLNSSDQPPPVDLSQPCNRHRSGVARIAQSDLHGEIVTALSGMAAEEIFAGESGAHVSGDLQRATAIGADMVGRYGMAGSLVSLESSQRKRGGFVGGVLQDARTRKQLESILRESKREAIRIMLENRPTIIALRDAMMVHQRLSSSQITEIIVKAAETRNRDDTVLVDLRVVADRPRPVASVSEL